MAAVPPPAEVQAAVADFYAARGDQLLAAKDLAAARTFYQFAVNAGSNSVSVFDVHGDQLTLVQVISSGGVLSVR